MNEILQTFYIVPRKTNKYKASAVKIITKAILLAQPAEHNIFFKGICTKKFKLLKQYSGQIIRWRRIK